MNPEPRFPGFSRTRINSLLNFPSFSDRTTRAVNFLLLLVIVINTIAIILDTIPSVVVRYAGVLDYVVVASLLVFAVEYGLRLWSYSTAPTLAKRTVERFRYGLSIYMIIDLASIMALFIPVFLPRDFTLLRTVRILSVFKLGRYLMYVPSVRLISRIFFKKREIISILVSILVVVILFSSTIMYLVENAAQPEKFASIPDAMWWAAMTVTTVGYGDIYPVTPLGKILGSVITIMGLLMLALPSAILAAAFIEEQSGRKRVEEEKDIDSELSLLERIAVLQDRGLLTDEEVDEYKRRFRHKKTKGTERNRKGGNS